MMAPVSATVPGVEIVQVISPAISPIYMNNPGYGVFKFDSDNGVKSLNFNFLQLEDFMRLGIVDFVNYDLPGHTGVDLNEPQQVRDFVSGLIYNF